MKTTVAILVAVMSSLMMVAAVLGGAGRQRNLPITLDSPFTLPKPALQLEYVNQIGGESVVTAYEDGYLYMGVGNRLEIVAVQNPEQPILLGKTLPFPIQYVYNLTVAGSFVYVPYGDDLAIVDVSEPTKPVVTTSSWPFDISDITISGTYAYVAAYEAGLQILDISDPLNPQLAGSMQFPDEPLVEIAVSGTVALVTTDVEDWGPYQDYGLAVLDLQNPISPTLVMNDDSHAHVSEVVFRDGYAIYMKRSDDWLGVMNLATLEEVFFDFDFLIHDMALQGEQLYLLGGCDLLCVMDVSDPAEPVAVEGYSTGGLQIEAAEGFVYVSDEDGNVHVLEMAGMNEVGYRTGFMYFLREGNLSGDYLFVEQGWRTCLIDLIQPTAPGSLGCISGESQKVVTKGDYAFMTLDYHEWQIVNIADPTLPIVSAVLDAPRAVVDIGVAGNYAFVSSLYEGLVIFDMTNPTQPISMTTLAFPLEHLHRIAIVDQYAYITGNKGFYIVHIANPTTPILTGQLEGWEAGDIVVRGEYAYLLSNGGLRIINVIDPQFPFEEGFFAGSPSFRDLSVEGAYAYGIDGGNDYLQIVDISNAAKPVGVGVYEVGSELLDVVVKDRYIYLTNGYGGLIMLWHSSPAVATIGPAGGGLVSADDQTGYAFPAGTFSDTVTITHTPRYAGNLAWTGALEGIGHFFEVRGVYSGTNGAAEPGRPYALTVHYTEAERGAAIEETLGFYYWDGSQWVRETSSVVDVVNNVIVAAPDHFGIWAVLGETNRTYFPYGRKN